MSHVSPRRSQERKHPERAGAPRIQCVPLQHPWRTPHAATLGAAFASPVLSWPAPPLNIATGVGRTGCNGRVRQAAKITFPLKWANTCCSHPLHCPEELEADNALGTQPLRSHASQTRAKSTGPCNCRSQASGTTEAVARVGDQTRASPARVVHLPDTYTLLGCVGRSVGGARK